MKDHHTTPLHPATADRTRLPDGSGRITFDLFLAAYPTEAPHRLEDTEAAAIGTEAARFSFGAFLGLRRRLQG